MLSVKKLPSLSISSAMISYKGDKILPIFLLVKRTIRLFWLRMRGNGYFEAYGQKPDPAIRSGDLDFL